MKLPNCAPKRIVAALLLIVFSISNNLGYSLDSNSSGPSNNPTIVTIHEVAWQIRQNKNWQILEASPRKRASGYQYFRFKLLRHDGKVKVINIDPLNPNLRKLEQ